MIFFCIGMALITSKIMSDALSFRTLLLLVYAVDNNLLGTHGWSRERVLEQKTSDDRILEKIKRRVGQMEKVHNMRMSPRV
jgi:hypothetical protein